MDFEFSLLDLLKQEEEELRLRATVLTREQRKEKKRLAKEKRKEVAKTRVRRLADSETMERKRLGRENWV